MFDTIAWTVTGAAVFALGFWFGWSLKPPVVLPPAPTHYQTTAQVIEPGPVVAKVRLKKPPEPYHPGKKPTESQRQAGSQEKK